MGTGIKNSNRVLIKGTAVLFEGDSEDTDDDDDTETFEFLVGKGKTESYTVMLHNDGAGGGDRGTIDITVSNSLLEED